MTFPTPPKLLGSTDAKFGLLEGWMYAAYKALIIERDIVEVDLAATAPLVYVANGRQIYIDTTGASSGDVLTYNGTAVAFAANAAGGDVQGPSSSTATEIAVFFDTTGKEIMRVPVRIDALGNMMVARDPMGIKPLYYRQVGGELRFASELRALPRGEIDTDALEAFLAFNSIPAPYSIFRDVRKPTADEMTLPSPEFSRADSLASRTN